MESGYWLIAFAVLVGVEAATMALTTVWFAGGALAAFACAYLGAGIKLQLVVFVTVSFVLLFLTRPLALRFLNRHTVKTNVDSLVGRQARITAEVNNALGEGTAVVNGQEWTARAEKDEDIYPADTAVEICAIRGVKLIVRRVQEEG